MEFDGTEYNSEHFKKDKPLIKCSFCSQTNRKNLVFYKGLLSALICSDCVKMLINMLISKSIDRDE